MGGWGGGWDFWGFWGCMVFRGEIIYTKNTNVVTHNISDKEEEATEIIDDTGAHYVKRRRDDYERYTDPAEPGKFQP